MDFIKELNSDKGFPLQAILTGNYHDKFKLAEGEWYFESRELVVSLVGDISHHAKTVSSESHTGVSE